MVGFCDVSRQAYAPVVYFQVQMASGCYTMFFALRRELH